MSLVAVWSDGYLAHDANWLIWVGVRLPGDEEANRALILKDALEQAGVTIVEAVEHDRSHIEAVHDPGMVDYLETAHDLWVEAGYPEEPGADRVVPYVFPHPAAVRYQSEILPTSRAAMAGVYCMDTTTVIGPGTYRGARAATDGALTAASLVREGATAAYAPVRPPGHHAGTSYFGGSCYLNNAAVATEWLVKNDTGRVAILDIDAHHGNGTQEIFYERADVLYASVHVDPDKGWFPHFCGFEQETGAGSGRGSNLNLPLQPGSGDREYLDALERSCETIAHFNAGAVVVSMGVDAGAADPESPLQVTNDGFAAAGRMIVALGLPTVLIQEGGYHLESLGPDAMAILAAF
ncbi:MAG: histone deacetylase family protein [Acidimicrobiia bacterium]